MHEALAVLAYSNSTFVPEGLFQPLAIYTSVADVTSSNSSGVGLTKTFEFSLECTWI